jgi:hypothetical protein
MISQKSPKQFQKRGTIKASTKRSFKFQNSFNFYLEQKKIIQNKKLVQTRFLNKNLNLFKMSEEFALCWNNFTENITSGFQSLLRRGELFDCTLGKTNNFFMIHF